MKAWIASLCLFVLLIGIIVINAIYVHRISAHLCDVVGGLSIEDAHTQEQLDALDAYWQKHHPLVGLSIGYRDLDHVSELLISLRAAYETKSASEFESYRQLALDAATELSRLERFSIENLF